MPHSVRARLILRNDMRDTWVSRNPILAKGEIGAEIDTGLLKLGDGTLPYNDLSYINEGGGGHEGDGALVTLVNNKFTVANYGKYYYVYDYSTGTENRVTVDATHPWPSVVELDITNGVAKWVKPPDNFNFDKSQGIISGAIVSLAREPRTNSEATTKKYVDDTIATQIANASHLRREIVTEIPNANYADENTVYMLKDVNATGADKYKEYLLINNEMVLIGDTSVDLTNYVQKPNNYTSNNVVIFGNDGSLIDSNVSITNVGRLTVATTTNLGGVLSSLQDNFISVDNNGYMSINNVTTDKIVNGIQEFILDGGGA